MPQESPILDYQVKPAVRRRWGLSRPIWWVIAAFCLFLELAGGFAVDGRITGWGDITFITVFALITLVAFANAIRPLPRAG